ncbi:MAG: hypothetical protein R2838_16775 [Caldilineaceae bacterium]
MAERLALTTLTSRPAMAAAPSGRGDTSRPSRMGNATIKTPPHVSPWSWP